ncbi:restriction endonuclease subunit S [Lactococcus lactis subsp. lactis]|uniref:restriction endonuclease subunit S n=1 Tax=Lactococcus lactis TaxID=1358 RepID=UPI00338E2500
MKFKEFKIRDLFTRQTTNSYKGFNSSALITTNGKNKVVVNSAKNNGIAGETDLEALNKGNVITLSDTVNSDETIFYQAEDFIGFSHVNKLIPKYRLFNKFHALYIITALKKAIRGRYDYSSKFTSEIERTIIKLPVDSFDDYEPSWSYMEQYIKGIVFKYSDKLEEDGKKTIENMRDKQIRLKDILKIDNFELSKEEINDLKGFVDKEWKEVYVSEIFDIIRRGKRLIDAQRVQGDLPFVTAGSVNQGISSYISNPNIEVFPANSLTIDMFGKVFYRDFEYGADDHVAIVAKSDNSLSKEVLLFIAPLIEKAILGKFNYSQNFYASDVFNIKIKLPFIDSQIDYRYMENLSKSFTKKAIKKYDENILTTKKRILSHKAEIFEIINDFLSNP